MKFTITDAKLTDAGAIQKIYAPYVTETAYSFEYAPPGALEFVRRISSVQRQFPFLVCRDGETPIGYAYAHRVFEREAYSWVCELSVYINEDYHRLGIGKALYDAILKILCEMGYFIVYAIVESENEASLAFHRRLGFSKFAVFKNVGYKFAEWRSLVWMEKHLHGRDEIPSETIKYSALDKAFVLDTLANAEKLIIRQ